MALESVAEGENVFIEKSSNDENSIQTRRRLFFLGRVEISLTWERFHPIWVENRHGDVLHRKFLGIVPLAQEIFLPEASEVEGQVEGTKSINKKRKTRRKLKRKILSLVRVNHKLRSMLIQFLLPFVDLLMIILSAHRQPTQPRRSSAEALPISERTCHFSFLSFLLVERRKQKKVIIASYYFALDASWFSFCFSVDSCSATRKASSFVV